MTPENIAGKIRYDVVTAVASIEIKVVSLNVRYKRGTMRYIAKMNSITGINIAIANSKLPFNSKVIMTTDAKEKLM